MTIARAEGRGRQFHVRCERRGARAIDGPLRPGGGIPATTIQELRRRYEQQIQIMRELAMAGIPAPPLDESPLLDLGRRVAEMLPATARQAIVAAVRCARQRRRSLRLMLEIAGDAPELLRIPWELMALPLDWGARGDGEASFLLLNADVALVRQLRGVGLNRPLEIDRPLRLQGFAAAPRDAWPIDIGATVEAIEQARQSSEVTHWYDGRGTLDALQDRLRAANPQIVHLLCHAEQCDIGHSVPRYDLLLTHADGYTHRVNATDLARVLTLAHDLQLVLLQACHAGAIAVSADDGTRGQAVAASVALTLIRAGVPLVIAMQGAVAQPTAEAFVRACYATLSRGGCLGRAVAAGRIAMYAAGGVVDWSLPVIYQGSDLAGRNAWLARLASGFERLFL
ncbi:MAG: CHAT domain-containing protein [Roseiflexaceae bacterium]